MYLKDKAFKYLKSFLWQFQVTFNVYLDIGRDDHDDYDDGESSGKYYYEQHDDEKNALIRKTSASGCLTNNTMMCNILLTEL